MAEDLKLKQEYFTEKYAGKIPKLQWSTETKCNRSKQQSSS